MTVFFYIIAPAKSRHSALEFCNMDADVFEAITANVYHQGLFEWLKSAELRSTEGFMVGTDLESVKQQLCDLKVSSIKIPAARKGV